MEVLKPPKQIVKRKRNNYIFLCGSIEMGVAENWQEKVENSFTGDTFKDLIIFNPRRDDWDSSWVQSIDNPQFKEQVEWELQALEVSDGVIVYFDKDTKSPITLLEIGLLAKMMKPVWVVCPDGFWRKGNVEVVSRKYGLDMCKDLEEAINKTKYYLS